MNVKKPISLFFKGNSDGILNVFCNNKLYAQRPFENGKIFKLNLPFSGVYSFDGAAKIINITDIKKTILDVQLPAPERNKNAYIKKIFFEDKGESPARIFTDLNTIVVNKTYFNYPIEVRFFISLHEFGHFFYSTEWKCDYYAAYHFCKIGFNPSQGFESIAGILHPSERNNERIEKIYNLLKKQD